MLMADTMAIFLVILGFLLAFPGLWLLCLGLWPNRVNQAAERTGKSLFKSFTAGLPITLLMLLIAAALKNVAGGMSTIAALAVICVFAVFASVGVAGMVTTIGQRLISPADTDRPWKATLRGSIVLELTFLLPILGWFVILPASMIIGAGSMTLSLFRLRPATATEHGVPSAA